MPPRAISVPDSKIAPTRTYSKTPWGHMASSRLPVPTRLACPTRSSLAWFHPEGLRGSATARTGSDTMFPLVLTSLPWPLRWWATARSSGARASLRCWGWPRQTRGEFTSLRRVGCVTACRHSSCCTALAGRIPQQATKASLSRDNGRHSCFEGLDDGREGRRRSARGPAPWAGV